jgi:hypothetical protein
MARGGDCFDIRT